MTLYAPWATPDGTNQPAETVGMRGQTQCAGESRAVAELGPVQDFDGAQWDHIGDVCDVMEYRVAITGWLDIESAPRDGSELIGLRGQKVIRLIWWFQASTHVGGWLDENGRPFEPTHWMPLPAPPEAET